MGVRDRLRRFLALVNDESGQLDMNAIMGLLSGGTTAGGNVQFPSPFPGIDENGETGDPRTIDLGMGLIGVLDESGTLVSVRQAPQAAAGTFTGITEGERQQIASTEGMSEAERALEELLAGRQIASTEILAGQQRASTEAMAANQLAQLDRQLEASIKQQEAELAEKRRQFDVSTGLERERLAAEIKIAERQLQSNRQISQLDARTRLAIAQQTNMTTRRGQNLQLARSKAEFGARRAEFAGGALGNDAVRQAIFLLGGSGGTSPLEAAAQSFPTMDFEFGPETGEFDIGALTELPQMAGGGRVRPGEAVEVHDDEVVVNRGDGVMVVIPVTESAQGGGEFDVRAGVDAARMTDQMWRSGGVLGGITAEDLDPRMTTWLGPEGRSNVPPPPGWTPPWASSAPAPASPTPAPVSASPAIEEARRTFSKLLGGVFSAGPQAAFGGTGAEMEPLFGVDLKLPSQLAAVFPRLPVAVQNIIRQALGVRGINPQEFRRRRLAATPNPVFSGMVGVRP